MGKFYRQSEEFLLVGREPLGGVDSGDERCGGAVGRKQTMHSEEEAHQCRPAWDVRWQRSDKRFEFATAPPLTADLIALTAGSQHFNLGEVLEDLR